MPEVVGVGVASIGLGVSAEDGLPARVEDELRIVAHDRRMSLIETAAAPATASNPLGMLATGPVICLSLNLTRLPFRALNRFRSSGVTSRERGARRRLLECAEDESGDTVAGRR